MARLHKYFLLRNENEIVAMERRSLVATGRVGMLCAAALMIACDQSEPSADAGPDGGVDVRMERDASKCMLPEADGGLPTYRWSFDQQTLLENNGLIAPALAYDARNGFDIGGDVGCGEYWYSNAPEEQSFGNLGTPAPQRWRVSAWFRGSSDGTVFDFEGVRLAIQSGVLWVGQNGATPPMYSTSLNVGDGAWHGVALQVDATATPLTIQVFVDQVENQSPASLSWAPDLASLDDLYIGGKVDATATENDFDEVCFFLYE